MAPESFVDSITAAEFLSIKPRRVLEMARAHQIPAHPIGTGGRKTWRFRLYEIEASLSAGTGIPSSESPSREKRADQKVSGKGAGR